MTTLRRTRASALGLTLVLFSLVLGGCRPAPAPQPAGTEPPPTARQTRTPSSVPTIVSTATRAVAITPPPTSDADQLPPGWERHSNEQLSIALPPGWRVINLGGAGAQAVYDALKKSDSVVAGVLGGPEAFEGVEFWAFAPAPALVAAGVFIDNLNIRRSPLGAGRVSNMQEVLDVLLPEYEKMGLKVTSSDAALRISDFPAARITYTLATTAGGAGTTEVRGRQYIVATDADLWILSFTTEPEREGKLAADFETTAQSFQSK